MRSFAIVVIVSAIWTVTADAERVINCCKSVSTVEVTDPIIGVRKQRKSLPCVKAIIFETDRGDFCSDPRQPWVRRKAQQFIINLKISQQTSTPPPTSSISERDVGGSALAPERL